MAASFSSKKTLTSFIEKYYLDGENESALWVSDGQQMKTSLKSENLKIVSYITLKNFCIGTTDIAIYYTSQLTKLISPLEPSIKILEEYDTTDDTKVTRLVISDSKEQKAIYPTSEKDLISNIFDKKPKKIDYKSTVKLNTETIDKILKAQTATETTNVAFVKDKNKLLMVFGYSVNNTNQFSMPLEWEELEDFDVVLFDSEALKKILSSNKSGHTEYTLQISKNMLRLFFDGDELTSEYYISVLQKNQND